MTTDHKQESLRPGDALEESFTDEWVIHQWTTRILERALTVDELSERDWFDMAYGFCLAFREPDDAFVLALRIKELGLL